MFRKVASASTLHISFIVPGEKVRRLLWNHIFVPTRMANTNNLWLLLHPIPVVRKNKHINLKYLYSLEEWMENWSKEHGTKMNKLHGICGHKTHNYE